MNFLVFSTAVSKPAVGKDVQKRRATCFCELFKLALLKFQ
jgi:hypothetical protein